MTRLDPIIAVENVAESARWYEKLFGFRNAHGGDHFAVLLTEDGAVAVCLHLWGKHDHPSMTNREIPAGNGLLLYFRTHDLEQIYQRAKNLNALIEQEMHVNSNSLQKEFSFRDPDGYFLTVTEFHDYEG